MKLSIIIPVYNEADTIEKVIKKIDSLDISPWEKEVIIVDDGSTDGTDAIITKCANGTCCRYKIQPINKGKGAAICAGAKEATGDFIIVMDADMEYNPKEIRLLLDIVEVHNASVVFGDRFHSAVQHKKSINYYGNRFLTWLTNSLFSYSIKDMEVGPKLIKRDLFNSLCITECRFGVEPQITSKVMKRKIPIFEVPISYNPRTKKQGKKISWKDGVYAVKVLLKERFTK